jgi:hypothetical protein
MVMETPKIITALGDKAPRFQEQIAILEAGLAAKKIWNVQVVDAKFSISNAIDKAADFYAEPFYVCKRESRTHWDSNDPRHDISMFMSTTSAPKLLRNLSKHDGYNDPIILEYMSFLREVVQIGELIKAIKPFIVKGRRPVEKTEEQLRDETFNTGVCAICANRQKLDSAITMVMHGYQMSDYNHAGYRVGKCFGVGYKPYELSNEANVAFAPVLEGHRKAIAAALKTLPKLVSVEVRREKWEGGKRVKYAVTITKEANEYEFNQEIANRQSRLEYELDMVKADIKTNNAKIEGWTLQPLAYGSKAAV